MANEVTGKTLHFYQSGREYRVKGLSFDRAFQLNDATSTGTANGGMESVLGRAKTTMKVDSHLYKAGVEVELASVVPGVIYNLISGDLTTDAVVLKLGIFKAGTTNTPGEGEDAPVIYSLGDKISGKNLAFSYNGQTFKATSVSYEKKYTELDATSSGTTSPNSESIAGRVKITTKLDCLMYRSTAELIGNAAPTPQAVVITLDSGVTITGTGLLHQVNIGDEVNGICKVSYNLEWQGIPVEVGFESLTMATNENTGIFFEYGNATNKEINCTSMVLGLSISIDTINDAQVSYDLVVNGAITPAVYS